MVTPTTVASRLDPVTGADVPEYVVALSTAVALAVSAMDETPMMYRTSEGIMIHIEGNLALMASVLPEDTLRQARSLCFHLRNQVEETR